LALKFHQERVESYEGEIAALRRKDVRISTARLVCFFAALVLFTSGAMAGSPLQLGLGMGAALLFIVLLMLHARALKALEAATIRRDIHERHVARTDGGWLEFPQSPEIYFPSDHAYAWDIDVAGQGSLVQRIDVSGTRLGAARLREWLGECGSRGHIAERQTAVVELAMAVDFRVELEAAATPPSGNGKLDGNAFLEFTKLPSFFDSRRWLKLVAVALPLLTVSSVAASAAGISSHRIWPFTLLSQFVLVLIVGAPLSRVYDLVTARRGALEAFEDMLLELERASFESPLLVDLQARVSPGGRPPSAHLRGLRRWVGFADLRTQPLVHIFINPLLLWDLNVLQGLEAWNRRSGQHVSAWFEALADLEALASLACLLELDPAARLPEVVNSAEPLRATQIAHPLLQADTRVANDVALRGPGTTLIVTGSNMAGKSTLLRAVGLNVALALAGGPVCANRMQVPYVRLRASMRAQDSLQQGASYFLAELNKLRVVVRNLETDPPVLFLLDELLRGTNERARHLGAKAVLMHLLDRGATGLVATHDTKLALLEADYPNRVHNVHFTDIERDGAMVFDYHVRPGIVQTSNALKLLALAGIEVAEEGA
jgi:ABC-type iron transport system FetAB ATPase subunit